MSEPLDPGPFAALLSTAGACASAAAEARQVSRTYAIKACRAVESALIHELDAEPLRGLANLGSAREPCYAARVRGHDPDERLTRPSVDGVLCLNPHGLLVMTRWAWRPGQLQMMIESVPATDDSLLAEDARHLAQCLVKVLPRHIERAGETAQKFQRLGKLAKGLIGLLAELEPPEVDMKCLKCDRKVTAQEHQQGVTTGWQCPCGAGGASIKPIERGGG
jgi:hypothetical protein